MWRELKFQVAKCKQRKPKDFESFCEEKWPRIPREMCINLLTNYKKYLTAAFANNTFCTKHYIMFCLGIKYLFQLVTSTTQLNVFCVLKFHHSCKELLNWIAFDFISIDLLKLTASFAICSPSTSRLNVFSLSTELTVNCRYLKYFITIWINFS